MTVQTARVVLDASAVLAWVFQERGCDTIAQVLALSVVPAPTMAEVLYKSAAKGHRSSAEQLYNDLAAMGVCVEPLLPEDSIRAAELISASQSRVGPDRKTLSLGDGLCLAVSERMNLPVTGGDLHWELCDLRVPFVAFR